jgi:hypothetical protein
MQCHILTTFNVMHRYTETISQRARLKVQSETNAHQQQQKANYIG